MRIATSGFALLAMTCKFTECRLLTLYHHFPIGARSTRRRIDSLHAEEVDDKLIGQTHDIRAAGAEAPLHAVVVGAAGFRDGDFAVLNSDNIYAAIFGGYGKLLILMEIYRFHHVPAAGNLGLRRVRLTAQHKIASKQAEKKYPAQKQDPCSGFQEADTSLSGRIHSWISQIV